MTTIRFVGDFPLWAGALVALLVGVVAWRYYRRESHDLPGRLRWWLPALRAAGGKSLSIGGVSDEIANVISGDYPIARPLNVAGENHEQTR